MGIKIVFTILSALCFLYLRIMKELKKENKTETALLTLLAIVFFSVPFISIVAEKKNNDNEAPLYYRDGDEVYPNQELQNTKPIFAPPAHNLELGDAIHSAVEDLGIRREEVNVSPFLSFDVTPEKIDSAMLNVKFICETKERMEELQDIKFEIVQHIINKYEPMSITFSFGGLDGTFTGKRLILQRNDDDESGIVCWNLGYMSKEGIYKVKKMYKEKEN